MKVVKYIVQWKSEEKEFDDAKEALRFADNVAVDGVSSYVWVEKNGVRGEEPFVSNEWSI